MVGDDGQQIAILIGLDQQNRQKRRLRKVDDSLTVVRNKIECNRLSTYGFRITPGHRTSITDNSLAYLAVSLVTIPFRWGAMARRAMGIIGLPLALLVTIYTGVLLAACPKVPWHTPLLPVLFVASAIATGIALVILVLAAVRIVTRQAEVDPPIPKLEKLYSGIIAFQILVIILFVLTQIRSAEVRSMIGSGQGLLWWIGVIALGSLLPLIVGFKGGEKKPLTSFVMAALVLLGGFLLRYVILMAGQTVA